MLDEKATTGTVKCPGCGSKVLAATGYCVKCKKKTVSEDDLDERAPLDKREKAMLAAVKKAKKPITGKAIVKATGLSEPEVSAGLLLLQMYRHVKLTKKGSGKDVVAQALNATYVAESIDGDDYEDLAEAAAIEEYGRSGTRGDAAHASFMHGHIAATKGEQEKKEFDKKNWSRARIKAYKKGYARGVADKKKNESDDDLDEKGPTPGSDGKLTRKVGRHIVMTLGDVYGLGGFHTDKAGKYPNRFSVIVRPVFKGDEQVAVVTARLMGLSVLSMTPAGRGDKKALKDKEMLKALKKYGYVFGADYNKNPTEGLDEVFKKGQRITWTAPNGKLMQGAVISDVNNTLKVRVTNPRPKKGDEEVLVPIAKAKKTGPREGIDEADYVLVDSQNNPVRKTGVKKVFKSMTPKEAAKLNKSNEVSNKGWKWRKKKAHESVDEAALASLKIMAKDDKGKLKVSGKTAVITLPSEDRRDSFMRTFSIEYPETNKKSIQFRGNTIVVNLSDPALKEDLDEAKTFKGTVTITNPKGTAPVRKDGSKGGVWKKGEGVADPTKLRDEGKYIVVVADGRKFLKADVKVVKEDVDLDEVVDVQEKRLAAILQARGYTHAVVQKGSGKPLYMKSMKLARIMLTEFPGGKIVTIDKISKKKTDEDFDGGDELEAAGLDEVSFTKGDYEYMTLKLSATGYAEVILVRRKSGSIANPREVWTGKAWVGGKQGELEAKGQKFDNARKAATVIKKVAESEDLEEDYAPGKKIVYRAKTGGGVVFLRYPKPVPHQDQFGVVILKGKKVIKDIGSHPTLKGAKGLADRAKDIKTEDLDEAAVTLEFGKLSKQKADDIAAVISSQTASGMRKDTDGTHYVIVQQKHMKYLLPALAKHGLKKGKGFTVKEDVDEADKGYTQDDLDKHPAAKKVINKMIGWLKKNNVAWDKWVVDSKGRLVFTFTRSLPVALVNKFDAAAKGDGKTLRDTFVSASNIKIGLWHLTKVLKALGEAVEGVTEAQLSTTYPGAGKVKEPTHMKALARKAGKTANEAIKLWGKAQAAVNKQYPDIKKSKDEGGDGSRYYKLVTAVFKNMLGLGKEECADVGPIMAEVRCEHCSSASIAFLNLTTVAKCVECGSDVVSPTGEVRPATEEEIEAADPALDE
jgi:ribosomal protein S27E